MTQRIGTFCSHNGPSNIALKGQPV